MIALAFFPEWEIEIAFQLLCEDKPGDLDIDQFIQYMDGTWINGIFKSKMWYCFDWDGPRTNNHVEGGTTN